MDFVIKNPYLPTFHQNITISIPAVARLLAYIHVKSQRIKAKLFMAFLHFVYVFETLVDSSQSVIHESVEML